MREQGSPMGFILLTCNMWIDVKNRRCPPLCSYIAKNVWRGGWCTKPLGRVMPGAQGHEAKTTTFEECCWASIIIIFVHYSDISTFTEGKTPTEGNACQSSAKTIATSAEWETTTSTSKEEEDQSVINLVLCDVHRLRWLWMMTRQIWSFERTLSVASVQSP